MTRRHFGLLSVAAAVIAGLAVGSALADNATMYTSKAGVGALTGAQIYDHICSGCHMPGGTGATGAGSYPKLAANKNFVSWQFVAVTVLNGRNGMPPFGQPADEPGPPRATHLSDAQIADVVNYVRGHFENNYPAEVTAAQITALPHPKSGLLGPQ
jgi:mono/diheme cytochrome c family protein